MSLLCPVVRQVDAVNHQVAARMAGVFTTWLQFDLDRQAKIKEQLERILAKEGISDNVFEIAQKSLAG